MIRADQVDLDRSAHGAPAEARNASSRRNRRRRPKRPVLVLTEKDIPPSTPAPSRRRRQEGGAPTACPGSPLEVISWEKTDDRRRLRGRDLRHRPQQQPEHGVSPSVLSPPPLRRRRRPAREPTTARSTRRRSRPERHAELPGRVSPACSTSPRSSSTPRARFSQAARRGSEEPPPVEGETEVRGVGRRRPTEAPERGSAIATSFAKATGDEPPPALFHGVN